MVVQHAIYSLLNPIFDRVFIHNSYGCRVAKGTHMASHRAQQYLREVKPNSFKGGQFIKSVTISSSMSPSVKLSSTEFSKY